MCDLHKDSNTDLDFGTFLLFLIKEQYLSRGDYLILDNAAVHMSSELFDDLKVICQIAQVKIVFLLKIKS